MTMMIDECMPITEAQLRAARASPQIHVRPMMFSHAMVQRILDGSKTQTRRIARRLSQCAAGQVGDRLWVRETWCQPDPSRLEAVYAADADASELQAFRELRRACGPGSYVPWRPSMHMPRWAARIWLEILEVRLHHLGETTHAEAQAEGFANSATFCAYWDEQNKYRPGCKVDDNPWVWAITFRRVMP